MSQTQFISHAQVIPPTLVPRRGLGLFSALAIVIAILAGALVGGVVLLESTMKSNLGKAQVRLTELKDTAEITSVEQIQILQSKIVAGQSILNQHIYASQVIDFLETSILDRVQLTGFSYGDEKVRLDLVASGYVEYAQQIDYIRKLKDEVESVTFSGPTLKDGGAVSFNLDVKLKPEFLHTKPGPSGEGQ